MSGEGYATGVLFVLLGLWLIARTVTHDSGGKNLVDRVLSL